MKNYLENLKLKFFRSKFGAWYLELILWWDYKFGKDKINFVPDLTTKQIVRKAEQAAYRRGIRRIKTFITNAAKDDTYENLMKKITDLVELSKEDKQSAKAEALHLLYVNKGDKDIKSAKDQAQMVQGRIKDYEKLREHKKSRDFMRAIRKLKQEGKFEEAEKLEKEWRESCLNKKPQI